MRANGIAEGMKKFRVPQAREQVSMFPPTLDEYVTKDSLVRYIDAVVEQLDLGAIEGQYSSEGRPAFRPAVLIKILVYGKLRGVRSARELARACRENVAYMYLAQNERPDFRTISLFRKRHLKELGALLKQTVKLGMDEGIVTLKDVAIDGTKIRANASHNSFKDIKKLNELLNRLDESLRQDIELDEREDEAQGDDDGDPKLPAEFQDRKVLAERIRTALEREKALQNKAKVVSLTDPDAHFMKSRAGIHPSYNAQAAMDMDSLMVVGARVSTAGSDHGELKPMLQEIKETTGKNPGSVVVDKGYRATEGLVELEERGICGVVPLQGANSKIFQREQFIYDEEEDEYICPAGRTLTFFYEKTSKAENVYQCESCEGCEYASQCLRSKCARRTLRVSQYVEVVDSMHERLKTPWAKLMLQWRGQTIELMFAWLKALRKLFQFQFRGVKGVSDEWKFEGAAVNIFRLAIGRLAEASL